MSKRASFTSPLSIPEAKIGDFSIEHQKFPAKHKFSTANLRCSLFGQKNKEISFPFEVTYHYLREGGGTWMSDLPCEQAQHNQSLKGMKGKVLVGGLGLGYAVTVLAKRKSVKEITVVELNKEVIDLVHPYLKNKEKIKVVHKDLFDYLKNVREKSFNYAFYDIWQSDGEGTFFEVVCPLYQLSHKKIKHLPMCWNEGVMRGQIFLSIQSRIISLKHPEFSPNKRPIPLWKYDGTDKPQWHNWSVPYFKYYQNSKHNNKSSEEAARFYASIYGLPNWEKLWKAFTS